jgi:flagellar basal-body rod modification protein FlgD
MSATSPVSSSGSSAANQAVTTVNPSSGISTTDFMKLLSTEMSNQDPLQPMDPTQTMSQLAQFTTLQQMNQMSQTQSLATGNSFLGTQVTVPGTNGNPPVTSVVTAIDASQVSSGGVPQLILSGQSQEYPITSISQVTYGAPAPSSGTASSSSSAASGSSAAAAAAPATPSSSSN